MTRDNLSTTRKTTTPMVVAWREQRGADGGGHGGQEFGFGFCRVDVTLDCPAVLLSLLALLILLLLLPLVPKFWCDALLHWWCASTTDASAASFVCCRGKTDGKEKQAVETYKASEHWTEQTVCYCRSRLWSLSSRCQSFFATLDLIRLKLIVRPISAMLANWQQSRSIYW